MRNGILTQEEGAELLGPHMQKLHDCVDRAWARWLGHQDFATASRRTRASIVNDYVVQEVRVAFDDVDGVRVKPKNGSIVLIINDTAIVKFKKFRTKRLRTSGISTNARQAFLAQAGVLDGMVVTNLVVGYLLDDLELAPTTIAAACPMDDGNLWTLDLAIPPAQGQGGADTVVPPTPISPAAPAASAATSTTVRSSRHADENTSTAVNEE